ILAAILFPVFAQAREAARKTTCASNLHQIAMAANLYAQEQNGRFPPEDDHFGPLMPYVKNYGIFRCPSDAQDFNQKPLLTPNDEKPAMAATTMPELDPRLADRSSYVYRGGLRTDDWGDIALAGERIVPDGYDESSGMGLAPGTPRVSGPGLPSSAFP